MAVEVEVKEVVAGETEEYDFEVTGSKRTHHT
jgi:hypothetical protein